MLRARQFVTACDNVLQLSLFAVLGAGRAAAAFFDWVAVFVCGRGRRRERFVAEGIFAWAAAFLFGGDDVAFCEFEDEASGGAVGVVGEG